MDCHHSAKGTSVVYELNLRGVHMTLPNAGLDRQIGGARGAVAISHFLSFRSSVPNGSMPPWRRLGSTRALGGVALASGAALNWNGPSLMGVSPRTSASQRLRLADLGLPSPGRNASDAIPAPLGAGTLVFSGCCWRVWKGFGFCAFFPLGISFIAYPVCCHLRQLGRVMLFRVGAESDCQCLSNFLLTLSSLSELGVHDKKPRHNSR